MRIMKIETLFGLWDGKCAYCGTALKLKPEPREKHLAPTRDHFIPLSKGGSKGLSNSVLACRACNGTKNDIDPRDIVGVWLKLNPKSLRIHLDRLMDEAESKKKPDKKPRVGLANRLKSMLVPARKKRLS